MWPHRLVPCNHPFSPAPLQVEQPDHLLQIEQNPRAIQAVIVGNNMVFSGVQTLVRSSSLELVMVTSGQEVSLQEVKRVPTRGVPARGDGHLGSRGIPARGDIASTNVNY
ncbi:transport and Golgi organization 2 [Dorcoceras hygrometricum]|uniref:Transport and Golgi organization 2 n=1 Tax=Dorcoceras hygrometricum TaxID=472368 RepID=A0A2Z7A4H1_9LAMI|nr:transport and Golgi organization 2 [Dorcoceras hygrometricum]